MRILLTLLLFFFVSCGPVSKTTGSAESVSTSNPSTTTTLAFDDSRCNLSTLGLSSSLGSPSNIDDVVDLVNALPKPVTIVCFVQALNRPLYVNATSSEGSVQEAVGPQSPRVFIFKGNLIISIAPAGSGANLLELSFMYNNTSSLKGELIFPIQNSISKTLPFSRINTGGQTSCSACHKNETLDNTVTGTQGYRSNALKPDASKDVSLSFFLQQKYLCETNNDKSYRCQVIKSLFNNGSVHPIAFPSTTPTYFQSLGF